MFVYTTHEYATYPEAILITTSIEELKYKLVDLVWPRDVEALGIDEYKKFRVLSSFDHRTSYVIVTHNLNLERDIKLLYTMFKSRRKNG